MSLNNETYLSHRWEHFEKKRFYRVILSQDLLGDWVVTKVWGGISHSSGRVTHIPCSTCEAANQLISEISKAREKRGYILK